MEMETVLHRGKKGLGNDLIIILLLIASVMKLTVIGYRLPRDADPQTGAFIALSAGRIATLEALSVRQLPIQDASVRSAGRYSGNNQRAGE